MLSLLSSWCIPGNEYAYYRVHPVPILTGSRSKYAYGRDAKDGEKMPRRPGSMIYEEQSF
jgi:hypothetical protein